MNRTLLTLALLASAGSPCAQTPSVVSSISPDGNFVSIGTKALFTVGLELWSSDGKSSTMKVIDLVPSLADSVSHLVWMDPFAYFFASKAGGGWGLYKTKGTAATTSLVHAFVGLKPSNLRVAGGKLWFAGTSTVSGVELWTSNGSTTTVMVKDIQAGTGHSYPDDFSALGTTGKIVFSARNAAYGRELWITDGSSSGTTLVKDIYTGKVDSNPRWLTSLGSKVLFIGGPSVSDRNLMETDGTAAGTKIVKTFKKTTLLMEPGYLTRLGSLVYFQAEWDYTGSELWVTDGTAAGTRIVRDLHTGDEFDAIPEHLTAVVKSSSSSELFFTATTPDRGRELWRCDGTAGGTLPVGEIAAGKSGASFTYGRTDGSISLCVLDNGIALFGASDGTGFKLWKVDAFASADRSKVGCGVAGRIPSLGASEPRIGKTWEVATDDAYKGAGQILVFGFKAATRIKILGDCYSYIDLTKPHALGAETTLKGRHHTLYMHIPSDGSLVGLEVAMQAWHLRTDSSTKLDNTNGVFTKIGK